MSGTPDNSPTYPLEIDVHGVKQLLDEQEAVFILDCREQDEYDTVHLPEAMLIPMGDIPARVHEIEPYRDDRIIVHCHYGGRSLRVAQWLRSQGFETAQNMSGGIDAWALEIDTALPRY